MTRAPAGSLQELIQTRRVLICCGSGGVGKTTTSAALALEAAMLGRKAVVCTIDPARRLASSLGLTELGSEVVQVAPERFQAAGLEPRGSLHALMLDTKRTFDRLIERYAKDPERRRRILANKFYQQMSSTVVGSSDYMAMERLHELHEEGSYDLIVLDTPPTKHALDFLQAPERMSKAFDQSTLEVFLKPWADAGAKSLGFIGRALGKVVEKVDAVLGLQFVQDLADFFRDFEGMYEGFRTRAQRVNALLREPFTGFVVVTSPQPLPLQEAGYFCDRLREFQLPLEGVVMNRVHPGCLADPRPLMDRVAREGRERVLTSALEAAQRTGDAAPVEPFLRAFLDQELLAQGDRQRVEAFVHGPARGVLVQRVPAFARDVHDLGGLHAVGERLLMGGGA